MSYLVVALFITKINLPFAKRVLITAKQSIEWFCFGVETLVGGLFGESSTKRTIQVRIEFDILMVTVFIILVDVVRETSSQLDTFDNILERSRFDILGTGHRFNNNRIVAFIIGTLFKIFIHYSTKQQC